MSSSPIQDGIISRLKNARFLRYSDMRPVDVPNDLYNYHLKQLISKHIVKKTSEGYSLSPTGLQHVADVHHTSDQANRLFKINVITIVSRVIDGQLMILNQVRGSNPSYGKIGVMGGTILKGEPLEVGAKRKLEQETGVIADFRIVGCERRMLYKDNELFSDVLFPLAYAHASTGEPIDTDFGHNLWLPVEEAITYNDSDPTDSIKSISTILRSIQDGTIDNLIFFLEETQQHS